MQSRILGPSVLCCRYIRDKINCLSYNICLLFAGGLSIPISISIQVYICGLRFQ